MESRITEKEWKEKRNQLNLDALDLLVKKYGTTCTDSTLLFHKLRKIEKFARKEAEQACNYGGTVNTEAIKQRVQRLFKRKVEGFFVNTDPRGYALKIDDEVLRHKYQDIPLQRDMGGYGLLAPDPE